MKSLPLFAAAAAALAVSSTTTADTTLTLLGQIQPTCEVGDPGGSSDFDFGTVGAPTSLSFTGISLLCNSVSGVTVTLTSRNGGLLAGNANRANYQAVLSAPDVGLDLILDANTGSPDTSQADVLGQSPVLAAGTTVTLDLTVGSTPAYSGVYTDDLVISLVSGG